jgi:mono/diheme cytochrome c family protein
MRRSLITLTALALMVLACGNGASAGSPLETGGDQGAQLFRLHCTLCHGKDGRLGFNGAKDLTASALSRAEMIAQVTNGKGKMMPYKNVLTAKEIEAVVDYTRKLGQAR